MKNKLYRIPIFESSITYGGIPLQEYVQTYFPHMAKLENERVSIIYSGPMFDETIKQYEKRQKALKKHEEITKEASDILGVPLWIYAVGKNCDAEEVVTGIKLKVPYEAALGVREVNKDTELPEDYVEKIENFSNNLSRGGRIEKYIYTYEEFTKVDSKRIKIRLVLGGLKKDLNWEVNKKRISIASNGRYIDLALMILVKYNLSIEDFNVLCKMRILMSDVTFDECKSELFTKLDEILEYYKLIKKDPEGILLSKKP